MWNRRFAGVVLFLICCIAYIYYAEHQTETVVTISGTYYEKRVAITFDDGPRRATTEKLLDGLKERGVCATFFLVGKNIEGNEDLVKRMQEEGHLIGNHTYSHVELSDLPLTSACYEIQKTNDIIKEITGENPEYIRPPCGVWSENLLYEVNMIPVFWSVDPEDWKVRNAAVVVDRVMGSVKEDSVILMHDVYDTSVAAALEIIDQLKAQGYTFVTADEMLIE